MFEQHLTLTGQRNRSVRLVLFLLFFTICLPLKKAGASCSFSDKASKLEKEGCCRPQKGRSNAGELGGKALRVFAAT